MPRAYATPTTRSVGSCAMRSAPRTGLTIRTVFVVAADHGARVYGAEQIPLKTYEIPLLIYAPKHIAPQRVDALMTQIDIAPTVLGLLGLPYEAPFFGQDALRAPTDHRIAFFNHNHDVAIYRDGRMVASGWHKEVKQTGTTTRRRTVTPRRRTIRTRAPRHCTLPDGLRALSWEHRYLPST